MRARRRLSIRGQLARLLLALGCLLGLLIVLTTLQVEGGDREKAAETGRVTQLQLADSMRQSSNDLTRMVQLYVSTGQTRYRQYYDQILAIRSGTAPRPVDYTGSFWDEVLAHGSAGVRYGPPQSLEAQMRAAHFTADEFAALDASLRASNDLAQLELRVMGAVAPRIAQGVDAKYQTDVAPSYQLLVDQSYLDQKGVIMSAIDRFIDLVNSHTLSSVHRAQADNRRLFLLQFAVLAVGLALGALSFRRARRVLLGPLGSLMGVTRRVADGDYGERARVASVTELEELAAAFNDMATAIETDIGRRQVAERDALEAQRIAERANLAKSRFLASMSHELRTPMTGVTGMLELLEHTPLTAEQQELAAVARESADSLLGIIGDILDLSKIEAGHVDLHPGPFPLIPLLRSVTAPWQQVATGKGLALTWTVDDRLAPTYIGDALRLRQILGNLLSNAVKFTAEGRVLVEVTGTGGPGVRIAVTDTGPGLPASEVAGLFEEYRQAPTADGQHWAGTGLGLVISRHLARLMGGDLVMDSEPGVGTTLTLALPLPVGPDEPADREPAPARLARGHPVLLAEDHPVSQQVLRRQLALLGLDAEVVEDGDAAFARWRAGSYAAVLTDLNMPGRSGIELVRSVRAAEAAGGLDPTPVIALTANALAEENERCLGAGMNDVIIKPISVAGLAAKLQWCLPHLPWTPGPPPGGGPTAPDPAVIAELADGDPEIAATIAADFSRALDEDLGAMAEALDLGDAPALARAAHRLRGAAGMVGATELAEAAESVELSARRGELRGLPDVLLGPAADRRAPTAG